jgi:uncharacterized protein (UPF0335 family)
MNANELADLIGLCGDGGYNQDAATMLRQQANRIESLEHDSKILMQHIADINEGKSKLRHEIVKFARAILRKAQEK